MITKWVVENFTHESSYTDLVKAIKAAGNPLQEIGKEFKFADVEHNEGPTIFLGSIEMTKLVQGRMPNAYPVAYCHQPNYLCTRYFPHFGKYLFNDKYVMLPLKELARHKFFFYGVFGNEAMIFIRPDSGEKPFQARLVDLLEFDAFIEGNKDCENELVVVSCPKNVRGEWRFVVNRKKEIITCSTYRYQGQITKIPSAPEGATLLVQELLQIGYYPDSVFVMDIVEDNDGKYWLLEINSFSSAGLYACDKTKIVKAVSAIAEEEWADWHKKRSFAV